MKRIVFSLLILFTVMTLYGQKSAVDRVFDKYSGKEGYTTVYISSYMFNLLNKLESDDPEFNQYKKATAGINSIKILTQESKGSVSFAKELLDQLPRSEYKEMMIVKEEDQDVQFLAREANGKITEFLVIVSGGGEDALIAIQGDIDLESIASIAEGLDMPGLENLEELDKK